MVSLNTTREVGVGKLTTIILSQHHTTIMFTLRIVNNFAYATFLLAFISVYNLLDVDTSFKTRNLSLCKLQLLGAIVISVFF